MKAEGLVKDACKRTKDMMKSRVMACLVAVCLLCAGISVWATGLPVQAAGLPTGLADGTYEVAVTMSGGSGKASIDSPAVMTVQDGQATARIVFSSPNYDYMKVGGEIYYPVNTQGNSAFEIPVIVFDSEMRVIADTVAMSTPHEIEYTLVFDSSSLPKDNAENGSAVIGYVVCAAVGVLVICSGMIYWKGRRKNGQNENQSV